MDEESDGGIAFTSSASRSESREGLSLALDALDKIGEEDR